MSTIKLSRIVFEGPIQIAGMTVREYALVDGYPAKYDAHLHGEVQCIVLRDPSADVTIYVPLRLVRSMEAYDKHNIPVSSSGEGPSDYVEPSDAPSAEPVDPPRRRGRPRTKHLSAPGDTI